LTIEELGPYEPYDSDKEREEDEARAEEDEAIRQAVERQRQIIRDTEMRLRNKGLIGAGESILEN